MSTPALETDSERPQIDCSTYDVDRIIAQTAAAEAVWSSFSTPPEWDIRIANRDVSRYERLQGVVDHLAQMRAASHDFIAKLAYLTWSVLHASFWLESPEGRKAAAYGLLRSGIADHRYRHRPWNTSSELIFCEPEYAFAMYGDDLDKLTAFLRDALVSE